MSYNTVEFHNLIIVAMNIIFILNMLCSNIAVLTNESLVVSSADIFALLFTSLLDFIL